jgi:hypothetical protein
MVLTLKLFIREFALRKIHNGVYSFCSRKRKQGVKVHQEVSMRQFAEGMSNENVTTENGGNSDRNRVITKEKKQLDLLISFH